MNESTTDRLEPLRREHSYAFPVDAGYPHAYVCETGDPEDGEIRLLFVSSYSIFSVDYTPKHLYGVGRLIVEAMEDEGYCEHGVQREDCHDCMLREVASAELLRETLRQCVHVLEKGIEVRMVDQWPALKDVVPDAIRKAKAVLEMARD